jgi:hypothetical protein
MGTHWKGSSKTKTQVSSEKEVQGGTEPVGEGGCPSQNTLVCKLSTRSLTADSVQFYHHYFHFPAKETESQTSEGLAR